MKLSELISNIKIIEKKGDSDPDITSLHINSQDTKTGGVFFAMKGNTVDGHMFIDGAIEKGAGAIICEDLPKVCHDDVTYVVLENVKMSAGIMASTFYGNPSHALKIVGVTGTNGKTTTATLLYQLFKDLGYKVGLVSTVVNKIDDQEIPASMTTPDALSLQSMFRDMVDAGCTHAFMEVSSHALDQGRVQGIDFTGALLTNITHDHLDYHHTFEKYLVAKQKLFDMLHAHAFALANYDDENGEFVLQNTEAEKSFYALTQEDESFAGAIQFEGKVLANTFYGLQMNINGKELSSKLVGSFNAYNIMAIYGAALLLQESEEKVLEKLTTLVPPAGRFQHMEKNGRVGIVDYAHTPDALENVLTTIKDIKSENQRMITVVGCGGDRDKQKRGPMATITQQYSDLAIFTSDNPRSEDPHAIIDEMMNGIAGDDPKPENMMKVVDRREAIATAVKMSKDGDIILVAGKGHETYQDVKGVRHPFHDYEVLGEELEREREYEA